MTLLIAGTVRVPPENLERFKPHMQAMLTASRAEDGCIEYSYAVDVAEPGLVREATPGSPPARAPCLR